MPPRISSAEGISWDTEALESDPSTDIPGLMLRFLRHASPTLQSAFCSQGKPSPRVRDTGQPCYSFPRYFESPSIFRTNSLPHQQ